MIVQRATPAMRTLRVALSLHWCPFHLSVVVGCALYHAGFPALLSLASLCAGAVMTFIYYFMAPLPLLKPIGGYYNVGLKQIPAQPATRTPPVSCYYPTMEVPEGVGEPLMPLEDNMFVRGMAVYAKTPYFLLRDYILVRIWVKQDATPPKLNAQQRLRVPGSRPEPSTEPFSLVTCPDGTHRPIVVFSHGLAAFQQLYSSLSMDLAARGAIVICPLHSDGSASYYRDMTPDGDKGSYIKDLSWTVEVREQQLEIRIGEIQRVVAKVLSGAYFREMGFSEKQVDEFVAASPAITLAGHSFGGATALATTLRGIPGLPNAVRDVVTFDPWHLVLGQEYMLKPIASGQKTFSAPTLMLHSEQWKKTDEYWSFFTEQLMPALEKQPGYGAAQARKAERKRQEMALLQKTNISPKEIVMRVNGNGSKEGASLPHENGHAPENYGPFIMESFGGTDHLSVCDFALLSTYVSRHRCATAPPRAQIMEWANRLLAFTKNHV